MMGAMRRLILNRPSKWGEAALSADKRLKDHRAFIRLKTCKYTEVTKYMVLVKQ